MRWVLVPLLVSGCNAVFGIEQTQLQQHLSCELDADRLDEDGDGIQNRLDTCPGVPDPNQTDDDGDLIGTACDPDLDTPNQFVDLAYFAADSGCWVPNSTAAWTYDGDATSAGGELAGLQQRITPSTATLEVSVTAFELPQEPAPTVEFRMEMNQTNLTTICKLRLASDGSRTVTSGSSTGNYVSVALSTGVTDVRMVMRRYPDRIVCDANGRAAETPHVPSDEPLTLVMSTSDHFHVHHAIVYAP